MKVRQPAQYQDPETEAAQWHTANRFIIHACTFLTVSRQKVKKVLHRDLSFKVYCTFHQWVCCVQGVS